MKKVFFLTVSSAFLFIQHGISQMQTKEESNSNISKVKVLGDFENSSSTEIWNGTISVSSEFPAHQKSSLKISTPNWQPLLLESEKIPKDWSDYDYLKFDIYNPSQSLLFGSIQIFDDLATDAEAEANGQSYMGSGKIFINKGWNHYEFLLKHAKVEEGNRPLVLNKIRKISFTFGSPGHPLYVDNIRLVAGTETGTTSSHINPTDFNVVIDNRYVYPTLSGPMDEIKTSSEIKKLRDQAHEAIQDDLRDNARVADMQGLQTLYQRIPLITADVGIGIRGKLAWFQNEEDEKEILNYIIQSCNKASKELTDKLASHKTDIIGKAPEDFDIASEKYQTLDVPPYPPMKELKIRDGYLTDKNGKPVILLSMLGIQNKGRLTDYFAPNDHLVESFTAGGGSRYTIESSPVYKAFHKYPDAKRVGWDGWCGHLIKDRWAMGGKKETVVICLESNHIRQAVLEYMKLHYKEWKENPDLLYYIMGYELQYICYCDKSRQMYRDWLKSTYQDINTINKNWKTQYKSFSEIIPPPTHDARPGDDVNRAAWYDWTNFNTRRFTDYLKWVKSELIKLDPDTPICAGGTFSMLSSSNSISGIDEEMIINEVGDVIVNESGSSPIYSDLFSSLSEKKKLMFDPEMGWDTHKILLQFLNGKSDISKWWWSPAPNKEFMEMNQSSIPHSKSTPLADIAEVLKLSLDVRRLGTEITSFTGKDAEIAILYSKTSSLQVPPQQIQAGKTPYIDAVYSAWEGSRFLGCRIGFVSEKQILAGKLKNFKLLIIPAAKYMDPKVVDAVKTYINQGGTALIIPESFVFDQFAHETNQVAELGVKITNVILPPVLGKSEKVQNYDQSFSQQIVYGDVKKNITTVDEDIFSGLRKPLNLHSDGLVQTIAPGKFKTLAKFDDGKNAIIKSEIGKGSLYYLASPLEKEDYHLLLSPLVKNLHIKRPILAVDDKENLITGAEVRSIERENDYLIYASNLTSDSISFSLQGEKAIGSVQDLRTLEQIRGNKITIQPFQETIFRIEK